MTDVFTPVEWTASTEPAICPVCANADYLFTCNYHTESQKEDPRCPACAISDARTNMVALYPGLDYIRSNDFIIDSFKEVYDYRTLGMDEWCEVCHRPFLTGDEHSKWRQVKAYDYDNKVLSVHATCCVQSQCEHEECQGKFQVTAWRHPWGQNSWDSIPASQWISVQYSYADGTQYCMRHIEEWQENQHGDYFCCDSCGDYHTYENNDYFSYYDSIYCGDCRDSHFYTCQRCEEIVHQDDNHNCHGDVTGVIHSYGYKPVPCFFGDTKEPVKYHFGFELEVEQRNEDSCEDEAIAVQESLGTRAYLKYDGSLRSGFEVVTHPHTLEEYKENFPWEFIQTARRNGLVSWNSPRCGFHIHVSRYGFGPGMNPGEEPNDYYKRTIIVRQQHELKFIKLIYDNERQVQRLAGRKSEWALFNDKGNIWRKVKNNYQSDGHYSAVNVENYNTIEVRVFRGSLKRERLLANLEFVHSAVEYTRNLRVTATNKALSWIAYSAYVYQNANKYPYLLEHMDTIAKQDQVYDSRTEDGD